MNKSLRRNKKRKVQWLKGEKERRNARIKKRRSKINGRN
jgi:hypothetical protein